MAGFKNEKALWSFMRPRLIGKWKRVETITPEGFPDVMGMPTPDSVMEFIELKVAATPSRSMMEPGQIEFFEWVKATHPFWVAVGHPKVRRVVFFRSMDFSVQSSYLPEWWQPQLLGDNA